MIIKFAAGVKKSKESKKLGYMGMAFDSLPTAEKRGYDFVGWFTEKQGGTQLLVNQPITQSTYYAQYTEHKYTITVTNDVAGAMGDKTKDFTFQLKMTGNTPAEIPYTKGTETGTVNYSATSYRASCFTHYCIGRDVTQLNVLRNVHRRISLGYSFPTVYVLFMLLHQADVTLRFEC